MIKVVQLIPTLDRSGAEKQLTLLAAGLPRDEFDIEVVCLTRSGPYERTLRENGIPVTVLGKRWRFDPWCLRRLKQFLSEKKPDILHGWLFSGNAYARLAAGSHPDYAVVISERCVDSWKSGWQLWLDRKLIPRADRLVANSTPVAEFYQQLGFPPERTVVIRNGITIPDISQPDGSRLRRELDIPDEARVVGFAGRLAPQNRVTDLIRAFELIANHDLTVCFVIVGDGPQREELESFARYLHLDHLIRFVGHREDVTSVLSHLDVFWLASDFEGQSNSLMEAMALGRPVVVSDIDANRELVTHEEDGLVVPVRDRVAIAKATLRLLNDDDLARRLGSAAQRRMQTEFTVAGMIESYATLYRELVAGSSQ